MYKFLLFVLVLIAFVFQEIPCSGFQAFMIGAGDGNTIRIVNSGHTESIRLYGVQVLAKDQPLGMKASEFLSSLFLGREVEITPVEKHGDGSVSAMVSFEGESLNRKMIAFGLGWIDTLYCGRPECREWAGLQDKARENKLGVWSLPPMAPVEQAKIIKIEARCRKCGEIHKFYIVFTKDPRLIATARKGGYIHFPERDVIVCNCGAKVDLTSLKKTVEADIGKKVERN
jgi:endonuclease YncB( thermonuclease family)